MKTNHENVLVSIRRAISECKEDYVLNDVKKHLMAALSLAQEVGKKRSTRDKQSKQFAEEAKKNHEKWQKLIKDNIKIDNEKWQKMLKDGLKINTEEPNDEE